MTKNTDKNKLENSSYTEEELKQLGIFIEKKEKKKE